MERHYRKASRTSVHTSRRTYLLARLGWGAIALGILLFIFASGPDRWVAFNVGCVVVGILMVFLSARMNGNRKVDPDKFDEDGNAKKKVL